LQEDRHVNRSRERLFSLPFLLTLALAASLTSCGTDAPLETPRIQGCVEGTFTPYFGVLHAHTAYSDGSLTPAEAFDHGRYEGELDILVITDHLELLHLPVPPFPPVDMKWQRCREQADAAYDPGRFLADCGFEYSSGFTEPWILFNSSGHNNVFFSDHLFPMIMLDFREFYRLLAECEPCIGQFDHPGRYADHWNEFEYFPEVDEKMNLFEFNDRGPVWDLFFKALDKGWHLSPQLNQDNHSPDWGTRDDRRSGLFMTELTRMAMHEAMRNRRTFMTYDQNASIKMKAFDRCWMGSILSGRMPQTISIEVEAWDPDPGDGWSELEIYGPGGELLDRFDCDGTQACRNVFTFDARAATYFVARATQTDGDWLVAAPVWIYPE